MGEPSLSNCPGNGDHLTVGAAEGLQAQDLALMRFGGAGLIMLPLLLGMGVRNLGGLGWQRGMALTLAAGPPFGLAVHTGFVLAPLAHGVVLIASATTVSATFLALWFSGERASAGFLAGMAILLAGLVATVWEGLRTAGVGGTTWAGDCAFVAAGVLYGGFTHLLKRWRVDPVRGTAIVLVLSMAVFVPLYTIVFGLPALPVRAVAIQGVLQGACGGCLGVVAYCTAVRKLGAARASLFPCIVPPVATLGAVPLLGAPSALEAGGILLASLGLLVAVGVIGPFWAQGRAS